MKLGHVLPSGCFSQRQDATGISSYFARLQMIASSDAGARCIGTHAVTVEIGYMGAVQLCHGYQSCQGYQSFPRVIMSMAISHVKAYRVHGY